jgi:hypothetical protein
VSRPFVLALVCLAVLAPLLSLRDLGRLGPMSSAGVAIAGGFAASMVVVTATAIARGQLGGDATAAVLCWPGCQHPREQEESRVAAPCFRHVIRAF